MMGFMGSRWTRALLSVLVIGSIFMGACGDKSTPTTPAPTQIDVSGRWAADITLQGITARMTWMLTQTGGGVTGPVLVSLSSGTVLLNGFLTGTITGSSLAYTIAVGPGGIPNQPTCSGQLGGTMTITIGAVSTMAGPMSVLASNCSIQLPSSSITLTKQ